MNPLPLLLASVVFAVVSVRAAEPPALAPKPASKVKGSAFGEPPQEILLWENGMAPGYIEGAHKAWPGVGVGGVQLVSRIGIPSIVLHKPLAAGKNRKAVILCPGGAYQALASVDNGNGTLDPFLKDNFVVIVLKYRTVPNPKQAEVDALVDAKRAVRLVRQRAEEWGIDPGQIGVVGWSAGGNLALNLSSHTDKGNPGDADMIERQSCRPDFAALLCPWPTTRPANDYPISQDSPPAFIASAKDDKAAPTKFAIGIAEGYEKVGVTHNLWIIEEGGHRAFSFDSTGEGSHWRERFVEWLRNIAPVKSSTTAK
jgi:acetyl esterase/lipase